MDIPDLTNTVKNFCNAIVRNFSDPNGFSSFNAPFLLANRKTCV